MSRSTKSAVPRTKPHQIDNALPPEPIPTQGTRLRPLVLRRKGFGDEILYVPECSSCGKPILDFQDANISVVNEAFRETRFLSERWTRRMGSRDHQRWCVGVSQGV